MAQVMKVWHVEYAVHTGTGVKRDYLLVLSPEAEVARIFTRNKVQGWHRFDTVMVERTWDTDAGGRDVYDIRRDDPVLARRYGF